MILYALFYLVVGFISQEVRAFEDAQTRMSMRLAMRAIEKEMREGDGEPVRRNEQARPPVVPTSSVSTSSSQMIESSVERQRSRLIDLEIGRAMNEPLKDTVSHMREKDRALTSATPSLPVLARRTDVVRSIPKRETNFGRHQNNAPVQKERPAPTSDAAKAPAKNPFHVGCKPWFPAQEKSEEEKAREQREHDERVRADWARFRRESEAKSKTVPSSSVDVTRAESTVEAYRQKTLDTIMHDVLRVKEGHITDDELAPMLNRTHEDVRRFQKVQAQLDFVKKNAQDHSGATAEPRPSGPAFDGMAGPVRGVKSNRRKR